MPDELGPMEALRLPTEQLARKLPEAPDTPGMSQERAADEAEKESDQGAALEEFSDAGTGQKPAPTPGEGSASAGLSGVRPPAATQRGGPAEASRPSHVPEPDPSDPRSPSLTPDDERPWQRFHQVLRANQAWDHDFIGSPHDPARPLRAFVDAAGSTAAPALVGMLASRDDDERYWACVGLEWLGPRAGAGAADALEARVRAREDPYWPAAVALEAVDPVRARAAGAQRDREVLGHLVRFHLERGIEAACEFIEWVIDHEDEATILEMLGNWELRGAAEERCPPRLAACLRLLAPAHPSERVQGAAANLLAVATAEERAAGLIETLARSGSISSAALDRVAAHPDSALLVKPLVDGGLVNLLSDLLLRRRCAGWRTDPALMRPLLREKLERPTREWRYEQHDVHYAALCVAELRNVELIDSLVKAVVPENGAFAWDPLVRAFRALGAPAQEALRLELAACPPGERRERLKWMLAATAQGSRELHELLEWADRSFLDGRIEPSVYGAFRAYGEVLLVGPSAHAAFQLAWIDRAFGTEVVSGRVQWIRSLGFRGQELLAELGQPLASPLNGSRSEWDGGETQKRDPARAARAAEAGLPSLAAHWSREERYERAAEEQLARVRRAAAPAGEPV